MSLHTMHGTPESGARPVALSNIASAAGAHTAVPLPDWEQETGFAGDGTTPAAVDIDKWLALCVPPADHLDFRSFEGSGS